MYKNIIPINDEILLIEIKEILMQKDIEFFVKENQIHVLKKKKYHINDLLKIIRSNTKYSSLILNFLITMKEEKDMIIITCVKHDMRTA